VAVAGPLVNAGVLDNQKQLSIAKDRKEHSWGLADSGAWCGDSVVFQPEQRFPISTPVKAKWCTLGVHQRRTPPVTFYSYCTYPPAPAKPVCCRWSR